MPLGGRASNDDIRDGSFLPQFGLAREFREETGIELHTIAKKPAAPQPTTRPSFNIFTISYPLEQRINRKTLLARTDLTRGGIAGSVRELIFLRRGDTGIASFEREMGRQCLDPVIPYLRVCHDRLPIRSLHGDMFSC